MQLIETEIFSNWLQGLKDPIGKAAIARRLNRLEQSNHYGESEAVGGGVIEMKIHGKGPGYRLYVKPVGSTIVVLLTGGSKRRQQKDIDAAKALAAQYEEKKQ